MKKTRTISFMLVLIMLLSLVLSACGKDDSCDTHSYSGGVCTKCGHTCEHQTVEENTTAPTCTKAGSVTWICTVCGVKTRTEPIAAAGHDGDPCSVCGYEFSVPECFYYNLLVNNTEISSPAIVINGMSFTSFNSLVTVDFAELAASADGGEMEIYGRCTLTVTSEIAPAGTSGTESIDGVALIKDGTLYVSAETDTDGHKETVSLTFPVPSFEGLEETVKMLDEVLPIVIDWLSGDLMVTVKSWLEQNKYEIDRSLKASLESVFTVSESADGYVLALNISGLLKINELIYSSSISELVDSLMGEGTYESLPMSISAFLDMTVSQLVLSMKTAGLDVNAVIDSVYSLLAEVGITSDELGYTADELKTEISYGDTSGKKIGDILLESMYPETENGETERPTLSEFKISIAEFFTTYKDQNLYALISGETDPDVLAEMKQEADEAVLALDACTSICLYTDKQSKLTGGSAEITELEGMSASISLILGYESEYDYGTAVTKAQTAQSAVFSVLTSEALAQIIAENTYSDAELIYDADTLEYTLTLISEEAAVWSHPEYTDTLSADETLILTGVSYTKTTSVYTFSLTDTMTLITTDCGDWNKVDLGIFGTSTVETGLVDVTLTASGAEVGTPYELVSGMPEFDSESLTFYHNTSTGELDSASHHSHSLNSSLTTVFVDEDGNEQTYHFHVCSNCGDVKRVYVLELN